mgnify:CR=1 FL=1
MRVIGGIARGRPIKCPPRRLLRPTPDMLRETLFAILGERVLGCRFLDLYAGTGAVGIEAASRGAAQVTLVEKAPPVIRLLQQNLLSTGTSEKVRVIRGDANRACRRLAAAGERFDIVFLDPPYLLLNEQAVGGAARVLDEAGLLVVQHPARQAVPVPEGLHLWRTRGHGDNAISLLTRPAEDHAHA